MNAWHGECGVRAARRVQINAGMLVLALSTLACSHVGGDALPSLLRSEAFCVERHERDNRDLASQISEALREAGLDARATGRGACPDDVRFRVSYVDDWSWDMRMFLGRLTIEVVDPRTGEIVAFGESFQDSLSALGKTHRDVIDRAVNALLAPE